MCLVPGRRPAKRGGFASARPTTTTPIATATLPTSIPGRVATGSVAKRPLPRIASSINPLLGRNPLETGSQGVPAQRGNCLYYVIHSASPEQ